MQIKADNEFTYLFDNDMVGDAMMLLLLFICLHNVPFKIPIGSFSNMLSA